MTRRRGLHPSRFDYPGPGRGPVLELTDRFGSLDVWVNPASGKIFALRWPRGGMVRAWTLWRPPP